MAVMCDLIENIDLLHTTAMGAERIKRNLELKTDHVIQWCKAKISDQNADIERIGKNWYITIDHCRITVNANSLLLSQHIR